MSTSPLRDAPSYLPMMPSADGSRYAPFLLAPILLLAPASCGHEARARERRLEDPDRYEAYLAALALCVENPQRAGPGLSLVFERLEDRLAWNRTGSRRAIARLEEEARPVLLEYLVLEGRDQPVVRETLLPVFERASREERRCAFELVRKHGWSEAPELRRLLLEEARSDPDWATALNVELRRRGVKDARALRRFLREAGVEAREPGR